MRFLTTIADMVSAREQASCPLGLVPTMGYFHAGHQALVATAKRENITVVVSIFVNPIQFGPDEDYATYPRDMERDLELLQKEKVDVVFAPTAEEMYPPGYSTRVNVLDIDSCLEGEKRLGHFQGVATVVTKLFSIVRPNRSYFGQKDGQQVAIVRRLTRDLNLGSEIVVVPTVREPDGLALSSRNIYLSAQERQAAPVLYRALCRAEELCRQGERDAGMLRQEMARLIYAEPLAQLDYVSIADADSLEELREVERLAMASLAVRFGRARLIDNSLLDNGSGAR